MFDSYGAQDSTAHMQVTVGYKTRQIIFNFSFIYEKLYITIIIK